MYISGEFVTFSVNARFPKFKIDKNLDEGVIFICVVNTLYNSKLHENFPN